MKMKLFSILSALLLCTVSLSTFAQFEGSKEVFSSPKLKTTIPTHKVVAILPFSATITYKRPPKNYDENAQKAEEKALTTDLQSSMYTFLLRKLNNYSVSFQDVDRTNTLLKQAGVFDKLDELTQDSICKILKVDAVIKSKYAYEKTASEGAAIAKTVLFGSMGSKTGSGGLTMQVYNGADGELLWRFYKAMNDDVMSSTDELVERMMRKVSRNFPYEK
jgi:hypothetical protein